MRSTTRIFLLRHGETLWNTERRPQGQKDSKLTEKGREQARQNGLKLRKIVGSVPRIISSPLGRCRETVAIVANMIDFDLSQIEYEDRVKEISFGQWEGQKIADIKLYDTDRYQKRKDNRWDIPAPDGESYSMVADRLQDWLSDVDGQTLILVSHGCAGRILRGIYSSMPKDSIYSLDESHDAIYLLENGIVTLAG